MTDYTISSKDLTDAESFLVQFQTEMVPEANLERGGAVRDLLIKGFAGMYAYLRGEIDRVEARQSLLRMQEELLTDDDDISDAVDEILSNWFVSRKNGVTASVTATLHFLEKQAQVIPASAVFWRTNSVRFIPDTTDPTYVISESQMFPTFDATGTLVDYVADIPLVAISPGAGYNIDPGLFERVEVPGGLPYFSFAENMEMSEGGANQESTEEMLLRAETAISVRNLINNRSCDVTLQEKFPAITETLTVGMGEPEQIRDRRTEIAKHIKLHIGGCYDTYVSLPTITVEENHPVGGYFVRPDNMKVIFRDPELTYDTGGTFPLIGVKAGHVLYLRSGFAGLPRGFVITSVSDHELEVSANTPFPIATDEQTTNEVVYSIGWTSPGYAEIELTTGVYSRTAAPSTALATELIPYGTSRMLQATGTVILSGKPVQDILRVELTDPPATLASLTDPASGTLIFYNRVNNDPGYPFDRSDMSYQFSVSNPEKAQSMAAINKIYLGRLTGELLSEFDTYNLRVSYTTLKGFKEIDTYSNDRNNRIAAANHLIRARHPVLIEVNIPYRLKKTATDTLDEDAAAQELARHINAFDPNDDLDVSDLSSFIRNTYDAVGAVFPVEVYYYLNAPDGQQISFSTEDIISIFSTETNGVAILNAEDIIPPQDLLDRGIGPTLDAAINTVTGMLMTQADSVLDWLTYIGVSDRTIKYRTTAGRITFELRS